MGTIADFSILCCSDREIRPVEEWLLAKGFTDVRRAAANESYDLHARIERRAGAETYACVWVSDVAKSIKDRFGSGVAVIRATSG